MTKSKRAEKGQAAGVTAREVHEVEDLSSPRTPVIYEVVRRLGEEEMDRPAVSLWWSGIAAGLSISFSLLAQAILHTKLPEASWSPIIESFGYCAGFLMVVMARQQLFTESTITVVLPVLADFRWVKVWQMARLWAIVLAANLVGTFVAAAFCTFTPVLTAEIVEGMLKVSAPLLELTWSETLFRGIGAGFLMAGMVWLIPGADSAQFQIITLMTWLIQVGGFSHIVAGSMEAYMLLLAGQWSVLTMLGGFFVPVLIGNVIGGTVLFALISYAQVMKEI